MKTCQDCVWSWGDWLTVFGFGVLVGLVLTSLAVVIYTLITFRRVGGWF